jgi:hypothetical protein
MIRPLKSIIRLFKKHEKASNYEGMNNNIYRGGVSVASVMSNYFVVSL